MSTVDEKRAKMLAKLEARHVASQSDKPSEPQLDPSVAFDSKFARLTTEIEGFLAECAESHPSLEQHLDQIAAKLAEAQSFVAASQTAMSAYEVRKAQTALSSLQQQFSATRERLAPKKSFAFRSRRKDVPRTIVQSPPSVVGGGEPAATVQAVTFDLSALSGVARTIENCDAKDVALSELTDCTVTVQGCASTLHLSKLNSCTIFAAPVHTSVFVEECHNCTLVLACQQLRVHSSRDSHVYVHVTSSAIIEDCNGLAFAPYALPIKDDLFEKAGLDKTRNNWDKVEDFNWLSKDKQSPNWSVLETSSRKDFSV